MEEILNRELKILVALITDKIKTREDKKNLWAAMKREHAEDLRVILDLPQSASVNPGELIGFDIDHENRLIILNYTSQAHNVLHEIEGGWTQQLRAMRGLVYYFGNGGDVDQVELRSRGFEKFFNQSELPETSIPNLAKKCGNKKLVCREKADGHMVEYFLHDGQLMATTRGKFGTLSAVQGLEIMNRSHWIKADLIAKSVGQNLMTLVVELITPESEVHVDYFGEKTLYTLAAYDTEGHKIHDALLSDIAGSMPEIFTLPETKMMTLDEILSEVRDRGVENKEGWVVDCGGQLVKFKYETYIGMMVASKLSYKYIMRCIQKDRFEKMIGTLPEEIREVAEIMAGEIMDTVIECQVQNSHLPLYDLHSELDGGESYFRTICREFWREWASKHTAAFGSNGEYRQLELNI